MISLMKNAALLLVVVYALCTPLYAQSKSTEDVQMYIAPARVTSFTLVGYSDSVVAGSWAAVNVFAASDSADCGAWCVDSVLIRVSCSLNGHGSTYTLGRATYEIDVTGEVQGFDGLNWVAIGNTVNFKLLSNGSSILIPEQQLVVNFTTYDEAACNHGGTLYDDARFYIQSVDVHGAATSITDSLAVWVRVEEFDKIHPNANSAVECTTTPFVRAGPAPTTTNPVVLPWAMFNGGTPCSADKYPWYEVQILRLWNTDSLKRDDNDMLKCKVDWTRAQRLIVYGHTTSATLTLAEGTGYYIWRVRPIGNWYTGGIANTKNWGCWSEAPADAYQFDLTNASSTLNVSNWRNANTSKQFSFFFYTQFDVDKNWQFSRVFMEGQGGKTGAAEGITYASTLLQPVQVQTPVTSSGQVLVKQTVLDYYGRPLLQTLPATKSGVTNGKLSYDSTVALYGTLKYRQEHFDETAKLRSPNEMVGRIASYWSDATDLMLPSSEGYPFVRSLVSPDPLGRPIEQGAAGKYLRVGKKSVVTSYTSASERELVSMFGNEAPRRDQAFKTLTRDQNGVPSLAYYRGDGKVVATCLVATDPVANLLNLNDSSAVNALTINDTLRYGEKISREKVVASRRFILEDTMDVFFKYEIDPEDYNFDCDDICKSCDYQAVVNVRSVNGDSLVYADTLPISTVNCSFATVYGDSGSKSLLPGEYVMTRTLVPQQPAVRLQFYKDSVTLLQRTLSESMIKKIFASTGYENDVVSFRRSAHDSIEDIAYRMFMRYKYYRDSLRAANDTLLLPLDDCCDVILDTSYCKTGCETSEAERPHYEQMLIARWGATLDSYAYDGDAIATYIRDYDGTSLIADLPSPFAGGVGVIDSLLRKMIADSIYDCRKVYECWSGIVEGYWQIAWEATPTGVRPRYGVNILDYLIDCLGTQYCEAAEFAEKVTGDAWLLNLWSKLPKASYVIDPLGTPKPIHDSCANRFDYSATDPLWICDGTNNAEVNLRYHQLRACFAGSTAMAIDPLAGRKALDKAKLEDPKNPFMRDLPQTFNKDSVELYLNELQDSCQLLCEQRRQRFRDSLIALYLREGYIIEEYPDRIPNGSAPYDTLYSYELSCRVASLVTMCDEQCSFPIEWSGDTLVHPNATELAEHMKVTLSPTWKMMLPMEGDTCPNDEWTRIENNVILSTLVVEELNRQLDLYKKDDAIAGLSRWDIEPIIRRLAIQWPQISVCFPPVDTLTNPADTTGMKTNAYSALTVMVDKSKASHFEVRFVGESCQVVYVPPVTAEVANPYNANHPHPLVDLLNTYIRDNWAKKIPYEALTMFTTVSHYTTAFFNSENYYEMWSVLPLITGVWATNDDPLKPEFSCDSNGIGYISEGWDLCPEPLTCVNSKDRTLAEVGDFVSIASATRSVFRMFPGDDSLSLYGWLFFNVCGTQFSFYVDIPISGDSLMHLSWGLGNTYSRKMQTDRSEWTKWLTGQNFLDSVGHFYQDDNGHLAFINYLDSGRITTFDCLEFSCEPKPTDSCNYIPICSLCDTVSCGPICFRWMPADSVPATTKIPRISCTVSEVNRLMQEIDAMLMGTCLDAKLLELEISYDTTCFNPNRVNDRFVARRGARFYHYTLYYYDRAGNLVQTVPPKGFVPLAETATRATNTSHTMKTSYAYNTLGQLVKQNTPDGGTSEFWYDNKGRLRLSHNARQASGTYSYTNYDALGRIVEVGEKTGLGTDGQAHVDANETTASGTDRTITTYTSTAGYPIASPWNGRTQRNLRNRVSRTMTDVDGNTGTTADQVVTYYSYDPHGNVEWLVQAIPASVEGLTTVLACIEYDYDIISGKVLEVRMQPGRRDQFIQRYGYDHDQRVTSVMSSRDGVIWERDAAYSYYAHGPLKRMEMGNDSIQGVDYAYTINGWLKAINTPALDKALDPGLDGHSSGANTGFARDAFGMYLGYHEKDFVKSLSGMDSSTSTTASWHVPNPTFLYNGNISSWASNTRKADGTSIGALASVYHYDVLNRIRTDSMRTRGASTWDAVGGKWHSAYWYDGNGNIKAIDRRDETASLIDDLGYDYSTNTNKLTRIDDTVGAAIAGDLGDQAADNYAYDATGNLTKDVIEGINTGGIVWTPYNKIRSIIQAGDTPTNRVEYLYDASGNRVLKRYYYNTSATLNKTTWYVRDASGNVLGIYEKPVAGSATLVQTPIYGSSRVAVARPDSLYSTSASHATTFYDQVHDRTLGHKDYELADHLGNVRTTVTDVLIKHSSVYDAEVSTYTDYYPFGMQMPTRTFAASTAHRYGYNGKENDNDVKVDGGQQDYGFRIYDPRVARFLSVDPLAYKYHHLSGYIFCRNDPVNFIDTDGREPIKPLVGTAAMFRALLDNSPRTVGKFIGDDASNYLASLGNTEFNWKQMRPLPTQTGFFNQKAGRYIYTEKGGWLDMAHFMFYAGRAYQYKLDGKDNPLREAVLDGIRQEKSDAYAAKHSAFSYEDLPSDRYGAEFGAKYFDPQSEQTFGQQLESYLNNVLKATDPKKAPNYEILPHTEPKKPSRINETTTPVFTKETSSE